MRYVGEAIAAVAAEDVLTARKAMQHIKVTYERPARGIRSEEAMREGAPVLHDYAPSNIVNHIPIRKGDVEQGFAEADLIIEESYRPSRSSTPIWSRKRASPTSITTTS